MRGSGLVLLVALPIGANAETADLPPLPKRNVFRTPAGTAAKPVLPGDQPTMPWTEAQIANAAAKCKTLLSGDPLDYDLLPPIKEGMCGTPAPVLLRSVGHHPKVTINPPAILSCPMADVLGEWLRDTVQPEAKAVFGRNAPPLREPSLQRLQRNVRSRERDGTFYAPRSRALIRDASPL